MAFKLGFASLAGVLALVACSSSSSTSPSSTDACGAMYDAYVAYDASCRGGVAAYLGSRDRYVASCKLSFDAPGNTNAAKSIDACKASVQAGATACTGYPIACEFDTYGTLPETSACELGAQCASGTCAPVQGATCGVCAKLASLGAECGDGSCPPDSVCLSVNGANATCVARPADKVGDECGTYGVCKGGLVCNSASNLCAKPAGLGGACKIAYDCGSQLNCKNDTCVAAKKSGDACTYGTDICSNGSLCSYQTSTCVPVVLGAPGDACDLDAHWCKVGSCNVDTTGQGTCPAIVPDGSPCPTDPSTVCDDYAQCLDGVCKVVDPSQCK